MKDETDRKGFLKHCRIKFSTWIRVNVPEPVPVKVKDGEASSFKSLSTYVSIDWQTIGTIGQHCCFCIIRKYLLCSGSTSYQQSAMIMNPMPGHDPLGCQPLLAT